MTDLTKAQEKFDNTSVNWRRSDVLTTETIATDIRNYRPRENDWPGVDTAGTPLRFREWERGKPLYPVPQPTAKARQRNVIGYVNWYGENDELPVEEEPRRTFALDERFIDRPFRYKLFDMLTNSLLYRSEPEGIDREEPLRMHWYTTRYHAVVYNDIHYNALDKRRKSVYPFYVYRDLPLVDMNEPSNVSTMLRHFRELRSATTDQKTVDMLSRAMASLDDAFPQLSTGVVSRKSITTIDNDFCVAFDYAFKTILPRGGGWIYLRTTDPDAKHHDEVYIVEPSHYLVRGSNIMKEVYQQTNTNDDDDDDDTVRIDLDDDLPVNVEKLPNF